MSRYRRHVDKSFRPQSSDSESSDHEDYKITNADDMPDVVYVDQAYLQPAPSRQGYRPIQQSQSAPRRPSKSHRTAMSSYGPHGEPTPVITSSSSDESVEPSLRSPYDQDYGYYREHQPEIPSSIESDSPVPSPVDNRKVYLGGWDILPAPKDLVRRGAWLRQAAHRIYDDLYMYSARETVIDAWQAFWERLWQTFGPMGLFVLLPLAAFSLYVLQPGVTWTAPASHQSRDLRESLSPIPYADTGNLWSDAPAEPGIVNLLMKFVLRGGWPDKEPSKRPTHLWIVENLQKRYAETAEGCKEVLLAGQEVTKYYTLVLELLQVADKSDWENKVKTGNELENVAEALRLEINIQLNAFRKRMRVFYDRVKEEDLKLVRLADMFALKVWPSKEELSATQSHKIGPKDLKLWSPDKKVSEEEAPEQEAARILHLVAANVAATSTWVDASLIDANAVVSALGKIIYRLEEACAQVLDQGRTSLYDDGHHKVVWKKLLEKARQSGLSDDTAKSLKGLPRPLLKAYWTITDVQNTLLQVQKDLGELRKDLTSPNHVLGSRWAVRPVIGLYTTMAKRLEKSIAVLGGPYVQ